MFKFCRSTQRDYPTKLSPLAVSQPCIHVLGLGSIGTLTAHGLMDIPEPPAAVTVLLHHKSLYEDYIRNNRSIALRTLDGGITKHDGYDVEVQKNGTWQKPSPTPTPRPANKTNNNLIVSVKATQTVSPLRALKIATTGYELIAS